MASGGYRMNSGPTPDPKSGRSDRRGLKFNQIPASGWAGDTPEFPLPRMARYQWEVDGEGKRREVYDEELTAEFRDREIDVWDEAWRTPQAAMWSAQSWRWQIIAEYCRLKTVVEMKPDANAALVGQLHRYRDQIGLSPAGLAGNGWEIVADELEERRKPERVEAVEVSKPARRLRAVAGD